MLIITINNNNHHDHHHDFKLTCVNLPLAFSKSAWYFTFDWIFVFSAMRFNSGVSAIAVALALGMCLQLL